MLEPPVRSRVGVPARRGVRATPVIFHISTSTTLRFRHHAPAALQTATAAAKLSAMLIYAGIDEAGYGPLLGPLVVGRAVLAVDAAGPDAAKPASARKTGFTDGLPPLWTLLRRAVCRQVAGARKGRLPVNDSKKLKTAAAGIRHLEAGVLAFAALPPFAFTPQHAGELLDGLGEDAHRELSHLPWYAPSDDSPWAPLPAASTPGELAVARSMLAAVAARAGVTALDFAAAVVFEDTFNRMVAATRSKAAASFTFVARHLDAIWQRFGAHRPVVIIDRQSGRTRYRELLQTAFARAEITVLEEAEPASAYRLTEHHRDGSIARQMTLRFEVNADGNHMPASLASMTCKYLRELMMARFQHWFTRRAPHIKPTAGYAKDANRFWREIQPVLTDLAIDPARLRRIS